MADNPRKRRERKPQETASVTAVEGTPALFEAFRSRLEASGLTVATTADAAQTLDRLLSTYENAAALNSDMTRAHNERQRLQEQLEARITERTAALTAEIDERKRTEEALLRESQAQDALRASQQVIEGILNAIPARVFWKDRDLVYLGCNTVFANDAGFAHPEDLIGKTDYEMPWRDQADAYRAADREVIESGCAKSPFEEPQSTPIGEGITLLTSKTPLRGRHGEVIGVLGTYMDITEHKRATALSERLATLVEASPDFIGVADPNTRRVQYINSSGREMCGIGRDEDVSAMEVRDLHPPWMNQRLDEVAVQSAVRDGLWQGDGALLHRDGHEIPISMALMARRSTSGDVDMLYTVSRDITERKRTEEALRLFRNLVEQSNDSIEVLDPESGRFLDCNEHACSVLGYSRAEFLSLSREDITAEVGESDWIGTALKHAGIAKFEASHRRKDGSTFPVEVSIKLVHLERDYLVAAVRDITERRRAEEALRQSQATLQAALDQSPAGIIIADAPDGALSFVNDAALRIRGGDRRSIVDGIGITQYIASWNVLSSDGTPLRTEEVPLARALLYGETNSREVVVRRGEGDDRTVVANAAPIKDPSGKVVSAIVVFTDTTDRKRAEEALRKSEGELRLMAEAMPQIVWITRADGWNVYFTHRWVDYTGMTLQQSYGQGWLKPFHPDDLQRAMDSWRAAIQHGSTYSVESRLRSATGSYRWWLIRGVPMLDERGEVTKWIGTCTDIHELKQAEETLRHRQKLESVGTLASGIAHDFNNLLGSMMGNVSLAQKQLPDGHPSVKYMELALSGAKRAAALTKQMLAYSGKGQFQRLKLDLVELIREHLGLLDVAVPKNVRLQMNLPPTPVFVDGDPGQLEQILMNLIINAGEAIGEKQGTVSLELSQVTMRHVELLNYEVRTGNSLGEGTYALLTITDSGAGMNEETAARVFDPFFSTKFIGRGLGLAAVLGIVRGHAGGLTLESSEWSGTTFRVLLPSESAPVIGSETPRVETPSPGTGSATILVIDDEVDIVNMMCDVLELGNYRTLTATDPVIGVRLYKEQWRTIDLVILDYSMPIMNGSEVLIELRKSNPEVRVIISSGYSEEELARLMGNGRPLAVIQKPQTADAILTMVGRVLRMDSPSCEPA